MLNLIPTLVGQSFDICGFSSNLISISLAVVVGVGSWRVCLLIHDLYDLEGDLGGNRRGWNRNKNVFQMLP